MSSGERVGLLVVGGGPAGLAAAGAYRVAGGTGRVRIVSDDDHPPYFRPALTKDFLRGETAAEDLALETVEHYTAHAIELTLSTRVEQIDAESHLVTLETGDDLAYKQLVVATGSRPAVPPIDGIDHPDVRLLRSLREGDALRTATDGVRRVVVVGSGFIGCEAAASLAMNGHEVTVVSAERRPQQDRIGEQAATRMMQWLHDLGVEVVGGVEVERVDDGRRVHLDEGRTITAGLVLVAAGITPQGRLVTAAGGRTEDGRVVVDERMRSTVSDVFAAGDVAYAHNAAAGRRLKVEHWGEAVAMGEVAGTTAAGGDATWAQAPGFWSEVGGHELKYAGWGDGHDAVEFVAHTDDAFTVWYGKDGITVGVLTYEADADYERGQALVEEAAPFPPAARSSAR